MRAWIVMFLLAVVTLLGAVAAPAATSDSAKPEAAPAAAPAAEVYTPERVMAESGKAVVLIDIVAREGKEFIGSGFLVDQEGRIVTNYHVLRGATSGTVRLANGDAYDDISVINYDARRDLAVIKIKGFQLPTVRLGDSEKVTVGQRVVVIGHPEGLTDTVSDGILSAVRPHPDLGFRHFQISAPVSPGSSGGPVFSDRGEVIAVVCSQETEGQNLNYALPINYARGMIAGPVKCALKNLPVEKTGDESGTTEAAAEPEDGLKQVIEAAREVLIALDLSRTQTGSTFADEHRAAVVDSNLLQATEHLARAVRELDRLKELPGPVGELARRCLDCAARAGEAEDSVVDILLLPYTNSSEAVAKRYWASFNAAMADLKATGPKFRELCREQAPDLLATLPPSLQEIGPPAPGEGYLGIGFSEAADLTRVLTVVRKGPADRAGVRAYDTLLGVVEGPTFATQRACLQYIRSHAKVPLKFRVQRGDKEIILTVTPEPYWKP